MPKLKPGQKPQPKYQALKLLQIFNENTSAKHVGRIIGLHHTTVQRWRNPQTMLNQWEADRYAVRLGKHPSEIWTDWFDIDITD